MASNLIETDGPILCNPLTDPEWVIEKNPTSPTAQLHPFSSGATRAIDSVSVIKGSALFAESGAGAHYYAFSSQSTTYTEAFVNVKLPTRLKTDTGNGLRRAFISLGIHGNLRGVDLGLKNDGDGWMPWYYDPTGNAGGGFVPSYVAPSTATNAVMTVKPVNTTTMVRSIASSTALPHWSRTGLPTIKWIALTCSVVNLQIANSIMAQAMSRGASETLR